MLLLLVENNVQKPSDHTTLFGNLQRPYVFSSNLMSKTHYFNAE